MILKIADSQTFMVENQQQTKDLAIKIAKQAKVGDKFGLKGTLGAGKSFFASCFVNSLLDDKVNVLSPTFNLLHSYKTKQGIIHHFDLYRLKSIEELENVGFFECLKDGICLIEWPEIAKSFLFKNYTEIDIKIIQQNQRFINITKY